MSNLVQHARRELKHLLEHDDPMEREVAESVLLAVVGFASFKGHSGGSHAVAVDWLTRLLNFQALGPLTDDPAEWVQVASDLWQNTRQSSAFSHDAGMSYYLLSDDRHGPDGRLIRDAHAHTSKPAGTSAP
jgi:hypothetical protein